MKFCGQLGHGDKKPQTSPVQVTSGGLEDECVSHVSLGARHTLAVTEDGEVFSWGLGHFGVLGRSFTPYDHDPEAALAGFGEDGALDIPAVGERHREQNEQAVVQYVSTAALLVLHSHSTWLLFMPLCHHSHCAN